MYIRLFCLSALSIFTLSATEKEPSAFPLGGDVSLGLDSFRSLPEGSWGGNMGAVGSLNLAYAIPKQNQGFGIQGGGSFGVYAWNGRGSTDTKALQLQGFATVGLFRMTPHDSGFNAGACYDWDLEDNYGVFNLSPTIAQVRGQFGYLVKGGNEFGLQGSYGTDKAHKHYSALPVTFKAINQVNAFWTHIFKNHGETMIWAGTPYGPGLMYTSGRAGTYIVGASFKAPLTHSLSMFGHGVYMGARSGSGDVESKNYAANVSFGLTYAFGGKKTGSRPYLALANNSNFLVDTNTNY
ncbi:MAG: hypothetical protein K2Y01_07615 [Rhabdochlamydiaceae bacterium]|nr:hypothetical protein [Rhabdochlamydiaceae bacterium]